MSQEPGQYDKVRAQEKWQAFWEEDETFRPLDDGSRERRYVLDMFPYPSGDLHMGHAEAYAMGDVVSHLFCNKRGHRMKVLVHDGLGIWLCARRLEQGKFHWAQVHQGETVVLNPEQLQALIQGLPWQRIGRQQVVTML